LPLGITYKQPWYMNMQRTIAGGVIGGVVGLAIWYVTQRTLHIEFPLGLNVFRYATFWLTGGIIGGVAATCLRRSTCRLDNTHS